MMSEFDRNIYKNPVFLVQKWLNKAKKKGIGDHNAIALATVDSNGMPDVRMVLLKQIENESFIFFTNYKSIKANELEVGNYAAFVIYWTEFKIQFRVRGVVEKTEEQLSDSYFLSRPLQSQISAWASKQSRPIESRSTLILQAKKFHDQFGENPRRPDFWGGYRIRPLEIEIWSEGEFRLHDRIKWSRKTLKNSWDVVRLSP